VIDLLNRRFVPFYYNVNASRGMGSRAGQGADAAAAAFVKGKEDGPAFLAAFLPDGTHLGHTSMYGDKDEVFRFLRRLLDEHPAYDEPTEAEAAVLAATKDPRAQRERGRLLEELGRYEEARRAYGIAVVTGDMDAILAYARIARYERDWKSHAAAIGWVLEREAAAKGLLDQDRTPVVLERAYADVARGDYAGARKRLVETIKAQPAWPRVAELHFLAGVCAWFLHEKDWAHFHWVWIVKNRPDDRFFRRAYTAAAADGMPYANPELGGYEAPGNFGSHDRIADALRDATAHYEEKRYDFFGLERPADPVMETDAGKLVSKLRDGNAHRVANNAIVDQLLALGEAAVAPLTTAVSNADFPGRGYAGWALGKLLEALGTRPEAAMTALRAAAESGDPYVSTLTRSGMRKLNPR
jgi:tetratricopeptide (TPR) repeat protein